MVFHIVKEFEFPTWFLFVSWDVFHSSLASLHLGRLFYQRHNQNTLGNLTSTIMCAVCNVCLQHLNITWWIPCQVSCFVHSVILQADVAKEHETGKMYRANFLDKQGQTLLAMHPIRQVNFDIWLAQWVPHPWEWSILAVILLQDKVLDFGVHEELHELHFQMLWVYIESDFSCLIAWIGAEHEWDGWAYQAPGLLFGECNFELANWAGANDLVGWFQRLGRQVYHPNQDCSWSYQHPAKSLPWAASCCNPFQPTTCFWSFLDGKTLAQNPLILAGSTLPALSTIACMF